MCYTTWTRLKLFNAKTQEKFCSAWVKIRLYEYKTKAIVNLMTKLTIIGLTVFIYGFCPSQNKTRHYKFVIVCYC